MIVSGLNSFPKILPIASPSVPKIPKNLRSSLKEIIAMDDIDANEEAWSFRRQLDVIIEYKLPFISL